MHSWDLYRSFLAVAETGSFTAAARQLETTQPTIGRHIGVLEEALGTPLFTRSPRGLVLTAEGRELARHAEAMASAAAAAERHVGRDAEGEGGSVRLTAPEYVSVEVLPPILAGFCDRERTLSVELLVSNRNEDLLLGHADVAVRMAAPSQQALVGRRIGAVKSGLYAHSDYVARRGAPRSLADIANHTAIGMDRDPTLYERGIVAPAGGPPVPPPAAFRFRTDCVPMHVAAVRAGLGIGALHVAMAASDATLVRVLPGVEFVREMWVVMHEDLRRMPRIRRLFDALVDGLTEYVARQGG
jgi:DNA-binding transcriptional LysR family regulator